MTSDSAEMQAGRTRDPDLTARILDETARQLGERGYSALRIEHIASAIGSGKTAIYRRWPGKPELVAALLASRQQTGSVPDTGSVVDDLVEHAWQNVQNQTFSGTDAETSRIRSAMVQPEVYELYSTDFLDKRRRIGIEILEKGVRRSELPEDTDMQLVLQLLAGLVLYRTTLGQEATTRDQLQRVVAALVESPPRRAAG
ncbi:AcrR family transcriptional regulator [Microbacterium natoriense]|uniref:AcrR family transcriptional regulator n=1 Tax=Microbacterium natoriense TaxID=284570 RepID=A0AAW8EUA8_9MICO|nr:TetR/AcrR family transcriptional regulator [Microbacterium natoriense]MDQ0647068.1 AcrR family transcriptional regulator [Microbacterium natoriense]